EHLKLKTRAVSRKFHLAVVEVDKGSLDYISSIAYKKCNRCGGFERLLPSEQKLTAHAILKRSEERAEVAAFFHSFETPKFRENIQRAVDQIDPERIQIDIVWFPSFENRDHNSSIKNDAFY